MKLIGIRLLYDKACIKLVILYTSATIQATSCSLLQSTCTLWTLVKFSRYGVPPPKVVPPPGDAVLSP